MANRIKKYNPAFLSPEELVRSFVVRHTELELIVQVIRENVAESNQHILVIGPRGIGKTMLVLRVVEEIREEEDLRGRWYPLVFGEESYQVSTPGEFWLEALFHLAHKTGEDRWVRTYKELRNELDEERLRERALAQLMDFADVERKRILLVVENFNMLLGEQISDSDAWKLRHTLLHEQRIMLLATATSRFEEIDNADKAMFELFKLYELGPLDEKECGILWSSISMKEASDERVRPLQILTGGNPRLLAIVSTFATRMSLKELMDDLMQLVDDNTEYFKSHLDSLPAIERKVYLALAELWDPVPARNVAKAARLGVSKASALLGRLMERGMVVEANGRGRTKLYQVSERMYNIYYLMRRRGAPSQRVKALVRFMVPFYGPKELVGLTRRIAEEACKLEPELRKEHFWAYECILEGMPKGLLRDKLIEITPCDFFKISDMPTSLKGIASKRLVDLLKKADALSEEADKLEEAELLYKEAIEMDPESGLAWANFGEFLQRYRKRYKEAEKAYRKAIELKPDYAWSWANLGSLLHRNLGRYEEAEKAYLKAIELEPDYYCAWIKFGKLLNRLGRYEEAEKAYNKGLKLQPECSLGWRSLGELLTNTIGRYEEAEAAYHKAIEIDGEDDRAWVRLGDLLSEKTGRYDEAAAAYKKAVELSPDNHFVWEKFGQFIHKHSKNYEEAEKAYRRAIELAPDCCLVWCYLGELLEEFRDRYDEAEAAYRKAIELGSDEYNTLYLFGNLVFLLLNKLGREGEALELAEEYLAKYPKNADLLNSLAWAFCRHGGRDYLARAEVWAKEALELAPEHKGIRGTLTSILSARGKGKEALEHLDKFLSDIELVGAYVEEAIDQFVGIAASGYGQEALEVLRKSPSMEILEPLVVGLRMYVGENVKAAAEIVEVGRDVVKRIEERREKMQAEEASENRSLKK